MKPSARFEVVQMTKVCQIFHGLTFRQQSAGSQDGDGRPGPGHGLWEGALECQPGKGSPFKSCLNTGIAQKGGGRGQSLAFYCLDIFLECLQIFFENIFRIHLKCLKVEKWRRQKSFSYKFIYRQPFISKPFNPNSKNKLNDINTLLNDPPKNIRIGQFQIKKKKSYSY